MKKFLLSLAVMALGASSLHAEALNVNDATVIEGTLVEESGNAGKHYQPLNSFKLGDYVVTFSNGGNTGASNQPAYYYPMSTSEGTQNSVRLYKQNTMTISSESGFGKVVITADKITAVNETNMVSASVGGFTVDATKKTLTWVNTETVKSVTFTMPSNKVGNDNPQVRIISLDITSDTGDVPENPDPVDPVDPTPSENYYDGLVDNATGWNFNDASCPDGLTFVWTWSSQYKYMKGSAFKNGVHAADVIAESPVIDLTNATAPELTFAYALNQYKLNNNLINVADFKGYAYVMVKEEGASSWSELAEIPAPAKFSWDWIDGKFDLKSYAGKKIQIGYRYVSTAQVAGTWEIKNMVVKETASSGVAEIETEAAGEAVYYNLQGVKVAEPENGLYIKVQGNKATKVLVRK